jgi:hypothetical protein
MADDLTIFMCRLSRNLGASTSWNPKGLSTPVMGLLYRSISVLAFCLSLLSLFIPSLAHALCVCVCVCVCNLERMTAN